MTQYDAFQWWNNIANYGRYVKNNIPIRPSAERMCEIFQEISPILYTHLYPYLYDNSFWSITQNIMKKLTKLDPFPDPCSNFPMFVHYLYTFKELLNPKTVDDCILYVNLMCPSPPLNFFTTNFIVSISNPELVIYSFYKMQEIQLPLWLEFLNQPGMIEKVFDLFIPLLNPQNNCNNKKSLDISLHLGLLLTQILMKYENISFYDKFAISLYKSIFLLIDSIINRLNDGTIQEQCYCEPLEFLRIIYLLNEHFIKTNNSKLISLISEKVTAYCSTNTLVREYILNWAFYHYGDSIKVRAVAFALIKKKKVDFWQINYLSKLLKLFPMESSSIIIPFLAKLMFLNSLFMRVSANEISKYFNLEGSDKSLCHWFATFIRCAFLAIHVFCSRKKYFNRICLFLTILSSSAMMNIGFIKDITFECVSFSQSDATKFIQNFFSCNMNISKEDITFSKKYHEFKEQIKQMQLFQFRTIPFQKHGTALLPVIKDAKIEANSFIDPRIADLNLQIKNELSQFIYIDYNMDKNEQNLLKYKLFDLIEDHQKIIEECRIIKNSSISFDTSPLNSKQKFFITGCVFVAKENDNEIFNFQFRQICSDIDSIQNLISLVSNHPYLGVHTKKLKMYLDKRRTASLEYARLKEKKILIYKYTLQYLRLTQCNGDQSSVNSPVIIRNQNNCFIQFISELSRLSNSPNLKLLKDSLSPLIEDYFNSAVYKSIVNAAAHLVSANVPEAFQYTVTGIVDKIMMDIHDNSKEKKLIIFSSLIRIIFGCSYDDTSELSKYEKENISFLNKAKSISEKKMKSLNLTTFKKIDESINEESISIFFNTRMQTLQWLIFETNPLDISIEIYGILQSALQYFDESEDTISQNDYESLLFGLLVSNPPANIVGIIEFLKKWENAYVLDKYKKIGMLFVKVSSLIYSQSLS